MLASGQAYALDPARTLTQYLHRIWQVPQGLPEPTVYSILQAHDGYLWLGTQAGLVRFDGVRFTLVDHAGDFSLNKIWVSDLLEGPDQSLWVGTNGAGLIRLRPGGHGATRYSIPDGLPDDNVHCLMFDSQGALWIGTPSGVVRWDQGKIQVYRAAQGLAANNVWAECQAKDGAIWFGGDGAQLSVWNGSAFSSRTLTSVPRYAVVRALLAGADGAIWIGTTHGLVRLKDGKEERFTTAEGLADNGVLCLSQSPDGSLWAGTRDGFSRLRDGEIESFRTRDGLSQSTVFTLAEDREGSLWVGTKHGLNQFLDRRLIPFTVSEGLPSNDTGPVFQDRQGNTWVGTLGAGLSRFDGRRFSVLTTQQGLAGNTIHALVDDARGDLWVGTDQGLNRLHDGKVEETYTTAQGLPANAIRCLLRDRQGGLWAGTPAGPAVLRDGRFVPVAGGGEPWRASILAMVQCADGSLLMATEGGGVYSYADGKLKKFMPNAESLRDVDAFYEDREGLIWMGTLGGGLLLPEGKNVVRLTVKDGLFDDDIFGMVCDDQDQLWMACSKGIFWVSRGELLSFAAGKIKHVVSTPFSPTDALRTIECQSGVQPAAWRMRDGRLWFSTIHGLIVIDSDRLHVKLPPAPVVIEAVTVNGREESPERIERLAPGIKNLEFRYSSLSFVAPLRITFRYRLDGFDKTWIDAGSRREAFYTNLPPGRFSFEVEARNVDGNWTQAVSRVEFVLAPHFYQEPWFIPICVAALVLAIVLGVRLRIRGIRRRLDVIVTERSRIARELHDTLLQGFSGVTMEMQALATRLPSSAQRSTLEEIIGDAGNCMREARQSVAGLRRPQQDGAHSGLAAAIAQVARHITEAKEIRLKLKLEECPVGLASDVEYNLLRIAQEAVANSVKHSGARTVEVALNCTPEQVRLAVKDDGSGFEQNGGNGNGGGSGHYGLIGMQERATQIGAQFRLDTGPGRGTAVSVVLPKAADGIRAGLN